MENFADERDNTSFSFMNAELFTSTPDVDATMFTVASQPQMTDFIEYRISVLLFEYISPIILVFGTIGNTMSIAVLRTRAFSGCPVAFTLSALAIVDTSVLYTPLMRQWLLSLTDRQLNIREVFGSVGCKVHMLLTYYLPELSSWTLFVLTVERSCCVCLPLLARTLCTRFKIRLLWAAIALILFSINAHFIWTTEYAIQPPSETSNATALICDIAPPFKNFFEGVWYWVDFALVSVLPFVFILTGNIIIIVSIVRASKVRRLALRQSRGPSSKTIPKRSAITSSTAMLIGVSVMFFLTTSPSAVFFLVLDRMLSGADAHRMARVELAYAVTNLLCYTNNAVNFLLYCLTGTRFRRALVSVFQRRSTVISGQRTREFKSNARSSLMSKELADC